MHKAQRLIHLMMLVNEKKRFTIRELTRETGVSRRTILRDLMELGELGVPLYSETGAAGGYRLLREKVLPPISFTEDEALALFFSVQSLQNYKSLPFEVEVGSALNKFYHHMSSQIRARIDRLKERLLFWVPPRELELPFLKPLLEASIDPAIVEIGYEGMSGTGIRRIQPVGVYTMNGLWYCQAYDFGKKEHRVYRMDRVTSFQLSPNQSDRMDSGREPVGNWVMRTESDAQLEMVVELTTEGVRRSRTDPWLAESLHIREDGTGIARNRIALSYFPWAVRFFLGYGAEAKVLQPPELVDEIRKVLDRLAKQYE